MNVIPLRHTPVSEITNDSSRHVARVELFDTFDAAEPYWHMLERQGALATPYQRYEFMELWHHHMGAAAGVSPAIVVGFSRANRPLFLWPFGRRLFAKCRILEFLGGKHANFNMGLWHRDIASAIDDIEIRAAMAQLYGEADALWLTNQPLTWQGATNPFALLPHQPSADFGFSGPLSHDFDGLLRARTNSEMRKKLRKKLRALSEFGVVNFERVNDAETASRVLDTFFKQKSERMQARGISDVFAAPEVRRFLEALAVGRTAKGERLIELYSLSVGGVIVATFGGTVGGNRFCGMFNSIISGRLSHESPGELLLHNIVRDCCERGLSTFDLGVGQAQYKNLFCGNADPLFDSFLPLTTRGAVLSRLAQSMAIAKRLIKHTPALWSLVRGARLLRARANILS
ncbi:MAG TPA: GNAT family N-acetyltransferase [Pseudolabrys sp.]|jgi:CelD/BcsL family acetyltransferase involved in cellulose biosynthesis|nr:GNAT family N-acetyltransferase [Pseudolabrys sp.]